MADISFFLKDPKASKKTVIYVFYKYGYILTDTITGKKKQIPLKVYTDKSIDPQYWDFSKQEAKREYLDSADINIRLLEYKKVLKSVFDKLTKLDKIMPTPEQLKQELLRNLDKDEVVQEITTKTNFINFLDSEIKKESSKNRSKDTTKTYRLFLAKWKKFAEKKNLENLNLEDMTEEHYLDFFSYLKKIKNSKGEEYKANSLWGYKKLFHKFLNIAHKKISLQFNHKSIDTGIKEEDIDSVFYSREEIQLLYEIKNLLPHLERVRDLFIVSCQTGLRYSDLSRLNMNNLVKRKLKTGELKEFISITTQKTGTPVLIPVRKETLEIYEKYNKNFPNGISNQNFNNYIKEVCKKKDEFKQDVIITYEINKKKIQKTYKKWELTSSHTGRRSFCTNMYLAGAPVKSIMAVSGHETEQSFYKYIKIKREEHSELLLNYDI